MSSNSAFSRIQQLKQTRALVDPRNPASIRHIVIVGGGSAGWMTAAALSNVLAGKCRITLIESEAIGIVGVGEATIPSIRLLNQTMGLDERDFLRETQGTFKLGIHFVDWGSLGNRYFHPFGFLGNQFDEIAIHQHWLKNRTEPGIGTLDDYSLAWLAAREGRFSLPSPNPKLLSSTYNYAFHFDASLYARHLRTLSTQRGVRRVEGTIIEVHRHSDTGFVAGLSLESGQRIDGDLFIDCSGFRSLLLGQTLGVDYVSWQQWLPCDRAVAMPCALDGPPQPFTRSTAREAGWQWTIPLRHRVGNGYVFSSSFLDPVRAGDALQAKLPGQALGDPRMIEFKAGRRRNAWEKNVIALGLASGFLEPLESTSLHLVHSGITTLLTFFPDRYCHEAVRNEYNRRFAIEMERIRDFLILHYKLTTRDDTELWRYCSAMQVPDSLQARLDLFRHGAHLQIDNYDLFGVESWLAVHLGQGNIPESHSPLLDIRQTDGRSALAALRKGLVDAAQAMPRHVDFLDQYLELSKATSD